MCNLACVIFAASQLDRAAVAGQRVLEVGSYNVNGSLRPLVESWQPACYVGVDLAPGPGVDRVCAADALALTFGEASFDWVISTEMLEHVRDWRAAVSNMKRVLAPGGRLLLTTRSPGYPYHAYPHDYWRFSLADMRAIFADCELLALEADAKPGVFVLVRKPASFQEADLADLALHSVVTGGLARELGPADFRRAGFRAAVARDRLKRWALGLGAAWLGVPDGRA